MDVDVLVEVSLSNSPCVEEEGEVAELLVMVAVLADDGGLGLTYDCGDLLIFVFPPE